jgi:hypothetical protein
LVLVEAGAAGLAVLSVLDDEVLSVDVLPSFAFEALVALVDSFLA